jgi:hypothetical protein
MKHDPWSEFNARMKSDNPWTKKDEERLTQKREAEKLRYKNSFDASVENDVEENEEVSE